MAEHDTALLRLVNHVLLPGFNGTNIPRWLAGAIDDGLAGAIYFGHNIPDPTQTRALSDSIHQLRDDVLVAVDEEGGDVTRLQVGEGSSAPGNAALGAVDDVELTREVANGLATIQRDAGIDADFAPSVDVNSNPNNPVIGVRSFGGDADLVARHGAAFVTGLQEAGIAACAKHFPGHGDTDVDSHLAMPVLDIGLDRLRERDFVPFVAAVEAGVKMIMVAHVRIPELGDQPATLNPSIMSLARTDLGFDGVLVTDALDMAGASHGIGLGGAAVRALQAGADLLCLGNPAGRGDEADYLAARNAIVEAIASGELQVTRLEEAAERIDTLVGWVSAAHDSDLPALHREDRSLDATGLEAAERAVQTFGDVRISDAPYVADVRAGTNIAAGRNTQHLFRMLAEAFPGTRHGAGGTVEEILAAAGSDPLIVVVRGPHRDSAEAAMVAALREIRPDQVIVHVGWPHEPASFGDRVIVAYGSSAAVSRAVVGRLSGS